MGILGIVLLVFFIIIAVLLILIVLIQNEEGDSLGGIFAGGGGSAFGARSGNVLTRATTILGAIFLVLSLGLALINRSPAGIGVEEAAQRIEERETTDWFLQDRESDGSSSTDSSASPLPASAQPELEESSETGEELAPPESSETEEEPVSPESSETSDTAQ
jgi:preprotein translocase subunit SecG